MMKERKTENPFNIHYNKKKFNILGRNLKEERGLPGHSKSKALKNREKTLYQEYRLKHKSNSLKDRRIGEQNQEMDGETKIVKRMIAESKKQLSKKNLFNLNEDEVLTHKGKTLSESNMNDNADFSDDEEEGANRLDANFVKEQHFGGGSFQPSTKSEDAPRTKKEWIEELIIESKRKKVDAKKEAEEHLEQVGELDSKLPHLLATMKADLMTSDDKVMSKKTCEYKEYDSLVRSLMMDRSKKSEATDRLKTLDEVAKQQKEYLEKQEALRLSRMKNEVLQEEEIDAAQNFGESADRLPNNDAIEPAAKSKKEKKIKVPKLPVEFDTIEVKKKKNKDLPFTFDVPSDFAGFWSLIVSHSPEEVATIIDRMIQCNHPTVGNNRAKCESIFTYLLQMLDTLCSKDCENFRENVSPFDYVEPIIPHMFTLAHLSPRNCAASMNQVINEKYKEYTDKKRRKYPSCDTFIFLKVAGLLFPASDSQHVVMTRVITFLTAMLGEVKPTSATDFTALLFTAHLLLEYFTVSEFFVAELSNALGGIIYLATKSSEKKLKLWTQPLPKSGASSEALVLAEPMTKYAKHQLIFSSLNDQTEMTEAFKIVCLETALTLLIQLTEVWSKLPSVRVIYSYVENLTKGLQLGNYPQQIAASVKKLNQKIHSLPPHPVHLAQNKAPPRTIRMLEPRICEDVSIFGPGGGSNHLTENQVMLKKIKRERKGAKRELKKDSQFLANVKLVETKIKDAERKRKVNQIMGGLAGQESEHQKRKKMKFTSNRGAR